MHYRDWWKSFDAEEYLNGIAETGVDGAEDKLDELYKAKAEGFEPVKFTILNEASIGVRNRVPGLKTFLDLDRFEYNTTRHGPGHAHISVVLCKDTGKRDANDRQIYKSSTGVLFTEDISGGTPEYFGRCNLIPPKL